jgi:branched-chain amino acid transport system ATP-binding protein
MSDKVVLEVNDLTKRFGGVAALDSVSFTVREGEIVGIIGPNGSGKTTLINVISGFLKPDKGRVRLDGRNILGLPAHKVTEKGMARTFQVLRPFYTVPACHNVVLSLLSPRSRRIRYIRRVGLAEQVAMDLIEILGFDRAHDSFRPTRTLPPGYLRRLDIARAIASEPRVLLADEPFSELTAVEAASVGPALLKLNSSGVTIVIIEHKIRYLMGLIHRVIMMHEGKIIFDGNPEDVEKEEQIRKVYYG